MRRFWTGVAALALVLTASTWADEGMWLFNHPPTETIRARYGYRLTRDWLDRVQRGSVRFNSGGSGSFVSADGLTFTNHHIAQTCLHALSTAGHDLYQTGFYAATRSDEARCPDLELNELLDITDVTARVNAGVMPDIPIAEAGTIQRANMSRLEAACQTAIDLRCQVVTFFSGAVYELYRYKKFTDVRLVFAPEFDAAFFGGDHDNFEFPRWDLDVAFFRVYENDRPAHPAAHLRWARKPLLNGDLVFVSGHPGSTDRLATLAQLDFLREVGLPFTLEVENRRHALLRAWGEQSDENFRRAQETIFGLENNLKRDRVYLSSLFDESLLRQKRAEEERLKTARTGGDPWRAIASAMQVERTIHLPYQLLERRAAFPGDLATYARILVRAAVERQKPNGERLREYSDASLPSLEQTLRAQTPVYKDMEELLLTDGLTLLEQKLPKDPVIDLVFGGTRSPADVAHDAVAGTELGDPLVRARLYEGGAAAIASSTDPMIRLMRTVDPEARRYRARYDDEVASVEQLAGATIGRTRFARDGFDVAPDATFTLRLSYGAVRGYTENGLGNVAPKGARVAPFTTLAGAFERATQHGNTDPFHLPQRWFDAKQAGRLRLDTPFTFVSTDDIIGGNSGSPVVNGDGDVVGIIFDGNMQSLPWRYAYDATRGRAVSVDARGIIEALRGIYRADGLVAELLAP